MLVPNDSDALLKVTSGALMLLAIRLFQYWNPKVAVLTVVSLRIELMFRLASCKVVHREVAVGQVARSVGLVIQAVVGLRRVAEVGALLGAEGVVRATIVAVFVKRLGNRCPGLVGREVRRRRRELSVGVGLLRRGLVLALALESEEAEGLVLLDWSADGSAELLARVVGMRRRCGRRSPLASFSSVSRAVSRK